MVFRWPLLGMRPVPLLLAGILIAGMRNMGEQGVRLSVCPAPCRWCRESYVVSLSFSRWNHLRKRSGSLKIGGLPLSCMQPSLSDSPVLFCRPPQASSGLGNTRWAPRWCSPMGMWRRNRTPLLPSQNSASRQPPTGSDPRLCGAFLQDFQPDAKGLTRTSAATGASTGRPLKQAGACQ